MNLSKIEYFINDDGDEMKVVSPVNHEGTVKYVAVFQYSLMPNMPPQIGQVEIEEATSVDDAYTKYDKAIEKFKVKAEKYLKDMVEAAQKPKIIAPPSAMAAAAGQVPAKNQSAGLKLVMP